MNQHQRASRIILGWRAVMLIVGFFVAIVVDSSSHAGEPSLEVISAWGGPVNDVEVAPGGNTAYIAAGRRLVVANISNLSAITELGSIELGANVRDLAIQNNLAYVATLGAPNYFCVVNISNPSRLSVVWNSASVGNTFDQFAQVELYGTLAYVQKGNTVQSDALDVYDLSQPAAPVRLGYIVESSSYDFEILGNALYVTTGNTEAGPTALSIYDLTSGNPLNPTLLGSVSFIATAPGALAVDGNLAFVSIDMGGQPSYVAVVNISNPAMPTVVSTLPTASAAQELGVASGHLYVPDVIPGTDRRALEIYSLANPASPALVTTYQTHATIRDILFKGGNGWVLDDGEGLIALDVSNPSAPVRLGNYHSPATLVGMDKAARSNHLYVADAWNGLTTLDVSNPQATPTVVGVFQTPLAHIDNVSANNWAVKVEGARAWLTAGRQGVHVLDISTPSTPSLVTTLVPPSNWGARAIDIANGVAHVSLQFFGPTTISLYRTYSVVSLAELATIAADGAKAAYSIVVNPQGIAFTGRDAQSPQVIDASNPSAPVVINDNAGPINCDFVALNANIRFLVNDYTSGSPAPGLYIHDVTNPANPVLLSFVSGSSASAVALERDRVYAAGVFQAGALSCTVWDVSTPSSPQPIVSAPRIGVQTHTRMLVDEPHLFVTTDSGAATTDHGLVILKGANLSVPPAQSEGKMYWAESDSDTIKRAALDGSAVEIIADALDGVENPGGLALDLIHSKLYFAYGSTTNPQVYTIVRSNFDGSGIAPVVTGLATVGRMAVDPRGGKIYWSGVIQNIGYIWRANLDGTGMQLLHNLGLWPPDYIALDSSAGKLYWASAENAACANEGMIERSNLDGTARESVVTGLTRTRGLAVDHDGGKVYWSQRCNVDLLRRANLDGTNPETLFPFAQSILGMAIDSVAGKLYFTEFTGDHSIMQCNLDGSQLEPLITVGLNQPQQIDVQPKPLVCPADINGNGTVNIDDLLALISAWGPCVGCPADINGNGTVNIDDLLALISAWGPCD
jgi:hypothetical protein